MMDGNGERGFVDHKGDNNGNSNNHVESFEKWYMRNVQLPQYHDALVEAAFIIDSMVAITYLTDVDLQQLGVEKKGIGLKS